MEEALVAAKADYINMAIPVKSILKKTFLIFGIYFVLSILFVVIAGFIAFKQGFKLLASENVDEIKANIPRVEKSLSLLKTSYTFVVWTQFLPFVGDYTRDLGKIIDAFEAALVGGQMGLVGDIDGISGQLNIVRDKLTSINPDKYSSGYSGKYQSIIGGLNVIKSIPYFMGMDAPRNFLILFQNDKELRPTGGFMTAYSIMRVDKGKFSPIASEDIYNLDAKYKPTVPAPEPLIKYIKGPYVLSQNLRLRDMNWSPDFGSSMINFTTAASDAGAPEIDGIIAVDTQVLVNILKVLGPVGVPGFGTYSTNEDVECKCPQVIHELESFADVEGPIVWDPVSGEIVYKPKNADNRKKIIGPLMNSIVASAIGAPTEKYPFLFLAFLKSLKEKHVLFYMFDSDIQNALSEFNLDGKIKDYDGDYLHVNDANLGGRKSNLYVTQEVSQEIEIEKGGGVVKTITLTYKNPEKHDGWLNSVLPNWVRVYVPKGSELLAVEGLEDKVEPYEDLGKTVFAGFFELRPEGISKVTFKYRLPFTVPKNYKMLIQKQPGTDAPLYTISTGKRTQEFLLKTDREIKLRI